MKKLAPLFFLTLLMTACQQPTEELSFDEQAARDQALAEERMKMTEDQAAADEEIFATMEPTDDDGDGYKTFTAEEFGVSFDFPADWIFDLSRYGADGYRVDLSNEAVQDGCTASVAQLVFTFPNPKEASESFEDYVRSSEMYDAGGSLGRLGGALTETTIAGQTAFEAESSGYETIRCEDEAYVVELDEGNYLFAGIFKGAIGNEADEIEKIFKSLTLR